MATATATYNYQVRDRSGKLVTGQLEADSSGAVAARLRQMGYTPVSVEQVRTTGMRTEIRIPGFGGRVKLKDLAIFSRQFATMINSGLSLLRAMTILEEQTENKRLAEVIGEVRADVEAGGALSAALAKHEKIFPRLYIAMVRAGETAGMLDSVLLRIADALEKEVALRGKIKAALTYPVIVLIMAVLLTTVMLIFIVPTFAAMFEDLGGELPVPTKILMAASNFMSSWAGLLTFFVLPAGVWYAYKAIRANPQGRYQLDRIKLKLPVFGPLFHKIAMARFARNLSVLLRAGVPILQALEITSETVANGPVAAAVKDVQDSVREGESIASPLTNHDVFPAMIVQMIAVGEETGAIDTMLEKVADFYDQEVESTTESLTALMEPLMIAVLGGIVGSMVIALYMPIFKVMELVE
ncbi:MAG TPA: type II secretion system F family protein [Nitriliruptorales bacterium]|nr:type II secretion system F family protein [Nitriliruptorales bacterium]